MNHKVHRTVPIHRGRGFSLNRENVTLPNGETVDLDVIRHPGAAAIVPLVEGDTVLLLRQFRYAAGGDLWEIPAGTLTPGESPLDGARRELAEETGYFACAWRILGEVVPAPGYSDERIHLFLAAGLKPSEQNLDRDEVIEVHRFPFRKTLDMVERGIIRDGKTICGLFLARAWMERTEFGSMARKKEPRAFSSGGRCFRDR